MIKALSSNEEQFFCNRVFKIVVKALSKSAQKIESGKDDEEENFDFEFIVTYYFYKWMLIE